MDYYEIEHPPVPIPVVGGPMMLASRFPLDSSVNLPDRHETAPARNRKGDQLFWTVSSHEDGLTNGNIWFTEFQGDTAWSEMADIGFPLNTADHNTVSYIFPDGESLLLRK